MDDFSYGSSSNSNAKDVDSLSLGSGSVAIHRNQDTFERRAKKRKFKLLEHVYNGEEQESKVGKKQEMLEYISQVTYTVQDRVQVWSNIF